MPTMLYYSGQQFGLPVRQQLVGCFMPAQLVSLAEGPSILLDKPILLVGRHPECDIQIDSRKISRRHCCIAQVEDYLVVRDLGSTNGIRINGVRVLEGRLRTSDELTIGANRYRISWDVIQVNPIRTEKAPRKRPEPSPEAVTPREEDVLQSSDDPVPLNDSHRRGRVATGHRATPRAMPAAAASANTASSDDDLIPEEIGLAPSESQVELPAPRPRKGIPPT
jgi:predicted component of type VI protein secretion system